MLRLDLGNLLGWFIPQNCFVKKITFAEAKKKKKKKTKKKKKKKKKKKIAALINMLAMKIKMRSWSQ